MIYCFQYTLELLHHLLFRDRDLHVDEVSKETNDNVVHATSTYVYYEFSIHTCAH